MTGANISHICRRADALAALAQGEYRAASLDVEGFIHLSQAHQVRAVLAAFYAGQSDLVLLVVAPELLHAPLRYEPPGPMPPGAPAPPPDTGQLFPHLYGVLNADAIVEIVDAAGFSAA